MDLPEIKGQHRKFRTLVTSYIGKVGQSFFLQTKRTKLKKSKRKLHADFFLVSLFERKEKKLFILFCIKLKKKLPRIFCWLPEFTCTMFFLWMFFPPRKHPLSRFIDSDKIFYQQDAPRWGGESMNSSRSPWNALIEKGHDSIYGLRLN